MRSYFALRSYRDDGAHYDGQIGSEPTPQAFLEALWAVTAECWRVLKPSGSMFVNLGDKRAGSNPVSFRRDLQPMGPAGKLGTGNLTGAAQVERTNRHAPEWGCRPKSKMLLPHRYAIGCEDGLADPEGIGWIVRQDIVWDKPNGLPESVRDRTRDSHEYVFHLTKSVRYYSSVDLIRQPHKSTDWIGRATQERTNGDRNDGGKVCTTADPLGALPGSVWKIASEPLKVPDWIGVDHFAAFPSELPRRLILGWSPSGVCTACGEGRRPVVETDREGYDYEASRASAERRVAATGGVITGGTARSTLSGGPMPPTTVTGESCACPSPDAPTRKAVILDPFCGTGTTVAVARGLGRFGIGVDLSADYLRLAKWRVFQSGTARRAQNRTHRDNQGMLL